ncbi:hypothetical protein HP550_17570 [Cellulomonas humilata]|uniref:Uncharacterized protein n=1 Tax=Cellulomonas humilata TaxID=144055 RepID=A0A7Y6A3G3_9CELL|nr:hypothetical protein [Cellulomonas humilata]NUU19061.1 hypothetical protein [Cellulomonas humilata]
MTVAIRHEIDYRLPLTVVRITGTDKVTIDKYSAEALHERTGDAAFVTTGDREAGGAKVALLRSSAFNDLAATLTLTDDQRLVSATSESTGTLGAAVTQTLGVVATAVGIALPGGFAPGTALDGQPPSEAADYSHEHGTESASRTAYRGLLIQLTVAIRDATAHLSRLLTQVVGDPETSGASAKTGGTAGADQGARWWRIPVPPPPDPLIAAARRSELAARLRMLHRLRDEAEGELARLDAHYAAWRAGTRSTHAVERSFDIRTDALPVQNPKHDEPLLKTVKPRPAPARGDVEEPAPDPDVTKSNAGIPEPPRSPSRRPGGPIPSLSYLDVNKLKDRSEDAWQAWQALGVLVVQVGRKPEEGAALNVPRKERDGVWLRVPRTVHWQLWRQTTTPPPPGAEPAPPSHVLVKLVREGSSVVVDGACPCRFVRFRRSLWARRSTSVELSDSGALRKFALTSTSAAAAVAAAAAQVPGVVSTGLTTASTLRTTWQTLGDVDEQRRLAELQRQIDLREKELKLAGLGATEAQHVELARLKQQAELIAARGAVSPTAQETATVVQNTALLDALRGASQASRELQAETELSELRLEIERLQAQWLAANPGKA